MRHEQEVEGVACEHGHECVEKIFIVLVLIGVLPQPPLLLALVLLTSLKMLEPSTPVQYVKGIGPRLAEVLAAKDIRTVDDLLHYLPLPRAVRLTERGSPISRRKRPGSAAGRRRSECPWRQGPRPGAGRCLSHTAWMDGSSILSDVSRTNASRSGG